MGHQPLFLGLGHPVRVDHSTELVRVSFTRGDQSGGHGAAVGVHGGCRGRRARRVRSSASGPGPCGPSPDRTSRSKWTGPRWRTAMCRGPVRAWPLPALWCLRAECEDLPIDTPVCRALQLDVHGVLRPVGHLEGVGSPAPGASHPCGRTPCLDLDVVPPDGPPKKAKPAPAAITAEARTSPPGP